MRKYRSFLSPDDALRDLRKHASQGAEIRWELHTSRTDVDLAGRGRCSCHSLGSTRANSEEKRHQPERGDLRKHHSAEIDKWSLMPGEQHELRKHLSDDSRMDRERRWTLQVPEVQANPRQRCTCPRPAPSPTPSDEVVPLPSASLRPSPRTSRAPSSCGSSRRVSSRSPTPTTNEQPRAAFEHRVSPAVIRSSPATILAAAAAAVPPPPPDSRRASYQQQQQQQQPDPAHPPAATAEFAPSYKPQGSKKEKAQLPESRKALRSRWAVKPHFSLPAERKDSKWVKVQEDSKSKSLKERPKYSIRRSMSPDPDPRQVMRLDNRVIRRLISPDVSLGEAKWAPYEGYSPLPNAGIKKREAKKMISDIKWKPYTGDESPYIQPPPPAPVIKSSAPPEKATEALEDTLIQGAEDPPRDWSPFHNITPTHLPPPIATPERNAEEEFRMRCLNQVSAFPIYQGAWREETPPPSPPQPPVDVSTPIWSPQEPRKRTPSPLPPPSPSPPPQKRSTLKLRASSWKKSTNRAKSQGSTRQDERRSLLRVQASTEPEEPKQRRQRPQLIRSKALTLDVPRIDPSKRSLSEEVRSHSSRSESTKRGFIFRAKSEDATRRYSQRKWLNEDRQELREYVTTV